MQFINPKTDLAFRKIFGSSQSKAALISFLNALLYREQPVIVDVWAIDYQDSRNNPKKIPGMTNSFLDVRAHAQTGKELDIQVQILSVEGWDRDALEKHARYEATPIPADEGCQSATSVVALTITDFVMFPEQDEGQSVYVLDRSKVGHYTAGNMELVFIELPKFTKPLDTLQGTKEKWLYFLQHAQRMHLLPPTLTEVAAISQAFELAQITNLSVAELEWQERKLLDIREAQESVARASEKERRVMERFEARMEKAEEIARCLLARFNPDEVAEWTNLPLETVTRLRVQL